WKQGRSRARKEGPGLGEPARPASPPQAGPVQPPVSPQGQAPGSAPACAAGACKRGQVPGPAPVSQRGRRRYSLDPPAEHTNAGPEDAGGPGLRTPRSSRTYHSLAALLTSVGWGVEREVQRVCPFPSPDHPRDFPDFTGGTEDKWISQVNKP
ncbi:unnamed protein product, partial [Rangifer tarandus platyrhynchus]